VRLGQNVPIRGCAVGRTRRPRKFDPRAPAEYGYPLSLVVPDEDEVLAVKVEALADRYGSPPPHLVAIEVVIGVPAKCGGPANGLVDRADARTRTGDPFITSEVLYQLSYVGEAWLSRIGV
jgi:hypothetical protein